MSDCRSRDREFYLGPVPYFGGDWSWNNISDHSPPYPLFIQEGLLSVSSKSMCTKYWLTACSSMLRKKSVVRWIDRPHDHSCCMGCKATNQTKISITFYAFDIHCTLMLSSSVPDFQIGVCNWKLFFLFLNQNICSFEHPKHYLNRSVRK